VNSYRGDQESYAERDFNKHIMKSANQQINELQKFNDDLAKAYGDM